MGEKKGFNHKFKNNNICGKDNKLLEIYYSENGIELLLLIN